VEVSGKYCSNCGEVLKTDDLSVNYFLKDAFHEIADVDSKFIRTIKYLMTRPGFLTLELLRGKRNVYIKPFRLYATLVVAHFLVFATFKSGDIFTIERFPALKFSPLLQHAINEGQASSLRPPAEFAALMDQKVKDNLEIFMYLVVFFAAGILYLLYQSFQRFYVQHLHFIFHAFSFALARNILVIPLLMLDYVTLTIVLVIVSQIVYVFLALKKVYPQRTAITLLKLAGLFFSLVATFYMALHVCVFAALKQI